MTDTINPRAATSADIALGGRIRDCRRALGASQEELAEHLGVTFQQVQKYENGRNRITATRLVDIAQFLKVSPSSLLEAAGENREDALSLTTAARIKTAISDVNRAMAALSLARQVLTGLQGDYPPHEEAETATHPAEFNARQCQPEEG